MWSRESTPTCEIWPSLDPGGIEPQGLSIRYLRDPMPTNSLSVVCSKVLCHSEMNTAAGALRSSTLDRNLLLGYARTRECSRHRRRRIRLGTSASLLAWRSACTVDLPRRSRLTGRAEVIHDQAEDDAHGRRRRLARHRRRCRASRRFWSPENGVCASATRAWRRVRSSTSPCGRTPPGSRGSTECRCPSDGEALPLAISPIGSDGRHEGGPCPRSVRIGFSPI